MPELWGVKCNIRFRQSTGQGEYKRSKKAKWLWPETKVKMVPDFCCSDTVKIFERLGNLVEFCASRFDKSDAEVLGSEFVPKTIDSGVGAGRLAGLHQDCERAMLHICST